MVMDLMTGGELFDRIVLKDHYSEQEARDALHQIVVAIQYCHGRNIVHRFASASHSLLLDTSPLTVSSYRRDLKPENILYSSPENNAILKLADFGLANILKPNELMHLACGTPGYVAPEVLRGQLYGKEVDMWSIGVILYILVSDH
jgi:serine/threonine protein kinase